MSLLGPGGDIFTLLGETPGTRSFSRVGDKDLSPWRSIQTPWGQAELSGAVAGLAPRT